jgi:hypothetical protein
MHLNMDNGDNRIENNRYINEAEARDVLMEFVESLEREI